MKHMNPMRNFSLRLSDSDRVILAETSKKAGISEADVIRICVKRSLPLVTAWLLTEAP